MKKIILIAVVLSGLTSACTVRSERTVVERPAPTSTTAVVVPDAPPPPPGTVVVPSN